MPSVKYLIELTDADRKILKDIGILDCFPYLQRNLYVDQSATVRTGREHQTGSKMGKEYKIV